MKNIKIFSKYLTYKEWKPDAFSSIVVHIILLPVSTLPIRNGNVNHENNYVHIPSCKYLTYKEWKLLEGSINIVIDRIPKKVSTLPIRNGNIIDNPRYTSGRYSYKCKYLTYKEWKHNHHGC